MIALACHAVDNNFYPIGRTFTITVPSTCLLGEVKHKIKSDFPRLCNPPLEDLTLWALSGCWLTDDNKGELSINDLLSVVRHNQLEAREVNEGLPASHYFHGSSSTPELHILVQHPVSSLDDTMPCQAQVIALDEVKGTFMNYGYPRIDSKFITIYVRQYKTWTWAEEDVCDPKNRIHLLWVNSHPNPQAMAMLDSVRKKLDKKRPTLLNNTEYVAFIKAVNRDCGDPIFGASTGNNMVSERELHAHNHALRNYINCVNTIRKESSFLKDAWFTSALVVPPMIEAVNSKQFIQEYKFTSGVGWDFSILVAEGEGNSYRKYSPNPDFMLLPSSKVSANDRKNAFCPILLGEVVSCHHESDRWRMLLQLAICARVNGLVTKDNRSPLVVQAVYLSKEHYAERYLAFADMKDSNPVPAVYITRDEFEVATRSGAAAFLRSMYNFQSVMRETDNALDGGKGGLCPTLATNLRKLPALTSRSKSFKPPGSSGSAPLSPIAIHADKLTRYGYIIYKFSTIHQHIAYANTSHGAVVLKCINEARANEIKLLTYLHQTSGPGSHTIPFTVVLSNETDKVISMPYRTPLNECSTLSASTVANFGGQLLDGVRFLHGQKIAHRDLKPENVVVDLHMGQLYIIDYDLAMFVDGRNELVHGYVGTDGFTAPEVGDDWKERYYSPIAADLWATGRVLEFLLSLSNDPKSPKLKLLQSISGRLLDNDPARRPGADKALDYILSQAKQLPFCDSSEFQQLDSSEFQKPWTPQYPRGQLTVY